ncbi:hypothetical protein [Nonomuraea sp. NPDC049646]|uniref:hypothetical protein n=1 Tax=unclassified Nonomuraea TaxID=2593643 RepID=UPI003793F18C
MSGGVSCGRGRNRWKMVEVKPSQEWALRHCGSRVDLLLPAQILPAGAPQSTAGSAHVQSLPAHLSTRRSI